LGWSLWGLRGESRVFIMKIKLTLPAESFWGSALTESLQGLPVLYLSVEAGLILSIPLARPHISIPIDRCTVVSRKYKARIGHKRRFPALIRFSCSSFCPPNPPPFSFVGYCSRPLILSRVGVLDLRSLPLAHSCLRL